MSSNTSKKTPSQREKFEQAARELETDDSEENFDKALKRIAVTPPKPEDDKPHKKRGD